MLSIIFFFLWEHFNYLDTLGHFIKHKSPFSEECFYLFCANNIIIIIMMMIWNLQKWINHSDGHGPIHFSSMSCPMLTMPSCPCNNAWDALTAFALKFPNGQMTDNYEKHICPCSLKTPAWSHLWKICISLEISKWANAQCAHAQCPQILNGRIAYAHQHSCHARAQH